MKRTRKQLVVSTKRPVLWTGLLERAILEFIDARKPALTNTDFDNLMRLPAQLVALVQAGALKSIDLRANTFGCTILLAEDPRARDDLDLADVPPRQQGRGRLDVVLHLEDAPLAASLGTEALRTIASRQLHIDFQPVSPRTPEPPRPAHEEGRR